MTESAYFSTLGENDGEHYLNKEMIIGLNAPPFHPNCRCTTVPYFDDDFEYEGTRTTRDERTGKSELIKDMTYSEWKDMFVDNKLSFENQAKEEYNKRTDEEIKSAANKMRDLAEKYSVRKPKWSGNIEVVDRFENEDVLGEKEWSCNIKVVNYADDGVILHEMLHSCSASYFGEEMTMGNRKIEEASVRDIYDVYNYINYLEGGF